MMVHFKGKDVEFVAPENEIFAYRYQYTYTQQTSFGPSEKRESGKCVFIRGIKIPISDSDFDELMNVLDPSKPNPNCCLCDREIAHQDAVMLNDGRIAHRWCEQNIAWIGKP